MPLVSSRLRVPARHRAAILTAIREYGPISRADLSRVLSLRPSSITSQARDLLAQGLIDEVGPGNSSTGRPPVLLDIARRDNYAVGIVLEPNGISAALVQWDGAIVCRSPIVPVRPNVPAVDLEQQAIEAAERVLCEGGVLRERVHGIGVGVSALVDTSANEAVFSSTFSQVRRFRFDALAESTGRPVYLEDIAYLMALGERWFVYPNDRRPLVFLLVSRGTCGAVLAPAGAPELPRFAAEFGHMVVSPNGPLCGCGKRGCLEALLSESALLGTAQRLLPAPSNGPLTLASLAALAEAGNQIAASIIETAGEFLGLALANIASVFAPALIVVGGSVAEGWGRWLLPTGRAAAHDHLLDSLRDRVEVLPSRLGGDAALVGCAARVMDAVFSRQ